MEKKKNKRDKVKTELWVKLNMPSKIDIVRGWAMQGATDEDMYTMLGISKSTFYMWKNKYPEFAEALKNAKDIADTKVVNALYQRATGIEYEEITEEPLWNPMNGDPILDENGQQIIRVTKKVKKVVVPDSTSMIFWLKNRQPDQWKDSRHIDANVKTDKKLEDFFG